MATAAAGGAGTGGTGNGGPAVSIVVGLGAEGEDATTGDATDDGDFIESNVEAQDVEGGDGGAGGGGSSAHRRRRRPRQRQRRLLRT